MKKSVFVAAAAIYRDDARLWLGLSPSVCLFGNYGRNSSPSNLNGIAELQAIAF